MRARHFTNALAHTLVLALLALPALGTAAHAAVPASVPSGAALYTGPGESYAAAGELAADTAVYAIETEGDWTLIDFPRDGGRARAYAATQSLSMDGAVREANLLSVQATTAAAGTLYASPDENAGILAEPGIMTPVTILRMEGDFAFIEMDGSQGQRLRGWTPASTVGATGAAEVQTGGVSIPMLCTAECWLYETPSDDGNPLLLLPAGTEIECYGELYNGFAIAVCDGRTGYIAADELIPATD